MKCSCDARCDRAIVDLMVVEAWAVGKLGLRVQPPLPPSLSRIYFIGDFERFPRNTKRRNYIVAFGNAVLGIWLLEGVI